MELRIKVIEVPDTKPLVDAMNAKIVAANELTKALHPLAVEAADSALAQIEAWLVAYFKPLFDENGKPAVELNFYGWMLKTYDDHYRIGLYSSQGQTLNVYADGRRDWMTQNGYYISREQISDTAVADICRAWPDSKAEITKCVKDRTSYLSEIKEKEAREQQKRLNILTSFEV